jgi:hypothetical protein
MLPVPKRIRSRRTPNSLNIKTICQVCGLQQLDSSRCQINQSKMAVRLPRAHVQSSKYPERAAVKVCDSGEIQDDGLCSLSNQSFHPRTETRCLVPVHESAHASNDSYVILKAALEAGGSGWAAVLLILKVDDTTSSSDSANPSSPHHAFNNASGTNLDPPFHTTAGELWGVGLQ